MCYNKPQLIVLVPGVYLSTQYFQVLNVIKRKKWFVPLVHFNQTGLKKAKSKALSRGNASLTCISHILVRVGKMSPSSGRDFPMNHI